MSDHESDVSAVNQQKIERLKALRKNVKWEIEEERNEFFDEFLALLYEWQGQLPNLRNIFQPEEIEWLLTESIESHDDDIDPRTLVNFVINIGYKGEPKVDEDGKLLLRRTTPIHHAFRSDCGIVISNLFKIYDRFDVNYTDEDGLTHFYVACAWDCEDVVEKFLDLGQVNPNLQSAVGCDTVSATYGQGKMKFFNIFQNNPDLTLHAKQFKDINMTIENIVEHGCQLVLAMYNAPITFRKPTLSDEEKSSNI
ncbi:hypothetical protein TKK_0010636 [Trichogramma kaykai]